MLLAPAALVAQDLARERRLAQAIESDVRMGSAVRLQANGVEFLTLHEEADSDAIQGAAILLHDQDDTPDSLGVIRGLRVGLTGHSWETLSLQMPMASEGAPDWEVEQLIPEALPRIQAAIDFFAQRNLKQMVLIGHGLGGRMAVRYLAEKKPPQIKGLILIGMALDAEQKDDLEALKKIELPLLDLMGDGDKPARDSARLRRKTLRYGGNSNYQQARIIGAGHDFFGREQTLLFRLVGWLKRYASNETPGNYKALGK